MDAVVKPWPKATLSDHVRAAPQPPASRPSREDAEAAVRTLIAFCGDQPERVERALAARRHGALAGADGDGGVSGGGAGAAGALSGAVALEVFEAFTRVPSWPLPLRCSSRMCAFKSRSPAEAT